MAPQLHVKQLHLQMMPVPSEHLDVLNKMGEGFFFSFLLFVLFCFSSHVLATTDLGTPKQTSGSPTSFPWPGVGPDQQPACSAWELGCRVPKSNTKC